MRQRIEWKDAKAGDWAVGNGKEHQVAAIASKAIDLRIDGCLWGFQICEIEALGFACEREVPDEVKARIPDWLERCVGEWLADNWPGQFQGWEQANLIWVLNEVYAKNTPLLDEPEQPAKEEATPSSTVTAGPMKVWIPVGHTIKRGSDCRVRLLMPYDFPEPVDDPMYFVCDRDPNTEIERLTKRVAAAEQWYAVRWEALRDLLKGTEHEEKACCIMANATASAWVPPTYSTILNKKDHQIESLKAELAKAKDLGWLWKACETFSDLRINSSEESLERWIKQAAREHGIEVPE